MRDTYVFFIFALLIGASTFLAYGHVVDGSLTLLPIITGFLGLLAKLDRPIQPSMPFLERLGISKPPPNLQPLSKSHSSDEYHAVKIEDQRRMTPGEYRAIKPPRKDDER